MNRENSHEGYFLIGFEEESHEEHGVHVDCTEKILAKALFLCGQSGVGIRDRTESAEYTEVAGDNS